MVKEAAKLRFGAVTRGSVDKEDYLWRDTRPKSGKTRTHSLSFTPIRSDDFVFAEKKKSTLGSCQ